MIYDMMIKTETSRAGVRVQREVAYGADAVTDLRNHHRMMAPTGSTQTITVTPRS
jgi:hypothetical protein